MPQHRRGEVDFSVDFAPVDADPNGRGSWVGTQFLEETVDVALSTVSSVKMMMSGRDEKPESTGMYIEPFTRVKSALLAYWSANRKAQIYIHPWAVPKLPLATISRSEKVENDENDEENDEKDSEDEEKLFTVFALSTALVQRLISAYNDSLASLAAVHEPPISMVFNQHAHKVQPMRHVPLPSSLLSGLAAEVLEKATGWLAPLSQSASPLPLRITGIYGAREYRRGATIDWHVDPAESQPLTAIVHIASSASSASSVCAEPTWAPEKCTAPEPWLLQIPRSLSLRALSLLATPPGPFTSSGKQDACVESESDCKSKSESLHQVRLEPGEVLLLQSARVPHARLRPLRMDSYANAFVHLAPTGWEQNEDVRKLV
jgi:hypothetical protein